MQINLVTSNLGKVKEFKTILSNKVKINHINMEYRELRSDNPEEIAKESAKRLSMQLKKTIVVEDSGLFIKALKDFPSAGFSNVVRPSEIPVSVSGVPRTANRNFVPSYGQRRLTPERPARISATLISALNSRPSTGQRTVCKVKFSF